MGGDHLLANWGENLCGGVGSHMLAKGVGGGNCCVGVKECGGGGGGGVEGNANEYRQRCRIGRRKIRLVDRVSDSVVEP